MIKHFMLLVLLVFTFLPTDILADKDCSYTELQRKGTEYQVVQVVDDVEFSWRYVEQAGSFESLARIRNTSDKKVEVSFDIMWYNGTSRREKNTGGIFILKPRETKGGEGAGLFFYPFEGKFPPTGAEFINIKITEK